MPIQTFPLGPLQTNSYLIYDGKQAIAVDVGGKPDPMLDYLAEHKLTLAAIFLTHRHFDHIYGVAELAEATGAVVYASSGDDIIGNTESVKGGIWGFPPVQAFDFQPMTAGERDIAGMSCQVLETPGHTPGGLSFYFPSQATVFTGDALFYRSVGRADFPGGDQDVLLRSIKEKLFKLPDNVTAYAGHGPATNIGDERKHNPFCGESSE